MKKTVLLSIFAAVFVFAVSGADQSVPAGWKGTIATENGVRIIKNPEQPLYGEFAFDLQQELSIGGDPTKDDYYFPRGAVLGVGQKGELIVSDLQNSRVMVYDASGKFLRQVGRQGQGPGEYSHPGSVAEDRSGNLCVFGPREAVWFDKNGAFMKKVLLKTFLNGLMLGPGGTFIGTTQPGGGPGGPKHKLLQLGPDGDLLRTIAEVRGEFREDQIAIIIHAYSNRMVFAPLTDEKFVYGFSGEYRLNVAAADGKTLFALTKTERLQPISSKERAETKENGVSAWIGTNDITLHDADFPDHRPFFNRIFTDDAGRIYLVRAQSIFDRGKPRGVDVFSKDGFYLYRMSWPSFPSAIKGGFWYEVRADKDSGEYFVVRSRIKNWASMKAN